MAQVRWTRQAADDFDGVVQFIAQDSHQYACLFAIRIMETLERLESFPESGRLVPECDDPAIRELLHGNYRLIYRVRDDHVELLTIFHGASLLDQSKLR